MYGRSAPADDRPNPGHPPRPRRIDVKYFGSGEGAAEESPVKHVRQDQVDGVLRLAQDLLQGIYPGHRLPDDPCIKAHEVSPSKTVPKVEKKRSRLG